MMTHVMISYRSRSDRQLARRLYARLADGQRWDEGFMTGLANSWVVVPIVSVGALEPMLDLVAGSDVDYMLVEWVAALELQRRGTVKAVLPLLVGEQDFYAEAHHAFGGVQALPAVVPEKTME